MKGCSSNLEIQKDIGCGNIKPLVTKIELKQKNGGKYYVRINGKGKWVECDYDPVNKTVKIFR